MSLAARVLLAIILPALLAGLGVALGYWAGEHKLRIRGALFQGIGLVGGFTAAQWAVAGWPPFPPIDVTQGLPYFGLLAILAGTAQASGHRLGWPLCGLVGALGLWFLLGPKIRNSWTSETTVLWLALLLAALMLV